nr:hypothetical protein [Tanacetum cinerariifolium]
GGAVEHRGGGRGGRAGVVETKIDFAAQQRFGDLLANFELVVLQEARQAQAQLDGSGIAVGFAVGLAEASHGE